MLYPCLCLLLGRATPRPQLSEELGATRASQSRALDVLLLR